MTLTPRVLHKDLTSLQHMRIAARTLSGFFLRVDLLARASGSLTHLAFSIQELDGNHVHLGKVTSLRLPRRWTRWTRPSRW